VSSGVAAYLLHKCINLELAETVELIKRAGLYIYRAVRPVEETAEIRDWLSRG
jgi:hypothetical protein|tara:strand:+ start:697 stop:855 length:159 start_codon:yes stop_codon:yes gene_type:complete